MATGYLGWTQRHLRDFVVGKVAFSDVVVSMDVNFAPSGISLQTLSRGGIYQRVATDAEAPGSLSPLEFAVEIAVGLEEDYFRLKRQHSIADMEPVWFFPNYIIEDVWPIPVAAKTDWTLTRFTPYDLLTYATYAPRAFIEDADTGILTEQTIVNTSPPSATEVFVDATDATRAIETPDISASSGDRLVFRYAPMFRCTVPAISDSIPDVNGVDFLIDLLEHIPQGTY